MNSPEVFTHKILKLLKNIAIDPTSYLLLASFWGFNQYYGGRFLIFVAGAIAALGLWAISQKYYFVAIPISIFFAGTWTYNFFEGYPLVLIMAVFLLLLAFAFWKLLEKPTIKSLTLLHGLYLSISTLIVWELAVIIKLFWPVEPWSRTFIVIAALLFLYQAMQMRTEGLKNPQPLLGPLALIMFLVFIVIFSTPIVFG